MARAAGDPNFVPWTIGVDDSIAAHGASLAAKLDAATASSTYTPLTERARQALAAKRGAALRRWWTGMAGREGASSVNTWGAQVCILGDSVSEGWGSTAYELGWVPKFRDRLRQRYPINGVAGGENFIPAWVNYPPGSGFPVTGSGGNDGTFGPGMKTTRLALGQSLSFTFTGNRVDTYFVQSPDGGVFSISVDGGALVNVNVAGGLDWNKRLSGNNLTNGPHTVVLAGVSGSPYVHGLGVYNNDAGPIGIRVFNLSKGGQSAQILASVDPTQLGCRKWSKFIGDLQPALIIVELGINDYGNGRTSSQFLTDLSTVVDQLNFELNSLASIVLVVGWQRGDTLAPTSPWPEFVDAMWTVASTRAYVTVFDLSAHIPNPAVDNTCGLVGGDLIHPTDMGHSFIADKMLGFLTP